LGKERCNLCNSTDFRLAVTAKDRMHDIPGEYEYFECKNCGLLFINPQPPKEEVWKHYPKNYYSYSTPNIPFKKFHVFLYKVYFSKKTNILLKVIFMPFRRILRTIKIVPNGKILDVGCGSGSFLNIPKELGFDCYGVEPGNFNKAYAKRNGFKIFHGKLEDARYKDDFFDVITLNHVFEHVDDPMKCMKILKKIIKKNGIIRIAVPQKDSFAYRTFKKYWVQLDAPRHFFLYSEKTLKMYAKKSGLRIVQFRYISSPFQITQSMDYWAKEKKHLLLAKIFESKIFFMMMFPVSFLLNRLHTGDSLEVILSK